MMLIRRTKRNQRTRPRRPVFRTKQGQIHISETIAVLFIFFVLVLFGMLFYFRYQQVAIKEQQEELLAARAMDTTLKSLFLPELICSRGEAEPEDNCFDLSKLVRAPEVINSHLNDYYFQVFTYANISVVEVYPEDKMYTVYTKRKQNSTRTETTFFVVSLRDERNLGGDGRYGYGYVVVEAYS